MKNIFAWIAGFVSSWLRPKGSSFAILEQYEYEVCRNLNRELQRMCKLCRNTGRMCWMHEER